MFEPPYQPDFHRNPALSLPYFYMFDQLMVIDLIDDVRKVLKLRRMAGIDQCMMWSAHEFFKIIHQDLSARLIQRVKWLVQDQDIRFLHESLDQTHLLFHAQ